MRLGAIILLSSMAIPASGIAAAPLMAHEGAHDAGKASVPPGFTGGDSLVHIASGMHFPHKVGNAVLIGERTYDGAGDYVALRYDIALADGSEAQVRIGIVQLPGMTAYEHYLSRRPLVLSRLVHPSVLEEGPLSGVDFETFSGRFTDGRNVRGLVTARFGNWGARAETAYALANAREAHEAISTFLASLNWQDLRQPAAGN